MLFDIPAALFDSANNFDAIWNFFRISDSDQKVCAAHVFPMTCPPAEEWLRLPPS
jgi:hypothetical protein